MLICNSSGSALQIYISLRADTSSYTRITYRIPRKSVAKLKEQKKKKKNGGEQKEKGPLLYFFLISENDCII